MVQTRENVAYLCYLLKFELHGSKNELVEKIMVHDNTRLSG